MIPVGVLISGSGTNLQALIDACEADDHPAHIAVVISNRPKAGGLERARRAGIPTVVLRHRDFESREAYDAALVEALQGNDVQWVCLAGFMRIITPVFLEAFPQRVLNIHPSLLPAFPGLHAQKQALDYGVRIAGVTVHFVDSGTDSGPIIAQGVVPVLPHDDEDSLKTRILEKEHVLYPMCLKMAVEGRLTLDGRIVRVALDEGESLFI